MESKLRNWYDHVTQSDQGKIYHHLMIKAICYDHQTINHAINESYEFFKKWKSQSQLKITHHCITIDLIFRILEV